MGVAEVLPGRLALVADHLVLALREPGVDAGATFVLSWYSVAYAAESPGGNLCFVHLPGTLGEAILTDAPGLDAGLRKRLSPRSWPLAEPDARALSAAFRRSPVRDGAVEAEIVAPELRLEVAWRQLGPPIVATGRVGGAPAWDTSTVLLEAGAWSASVNGVPVEGSAFPNEVWRTWFDRPLSSALVAIAEVFRETGA